MNFRKSLGSPLAILLLLCLFVTSCDEDDDVSVTNGDEGRLTLQLTDAPVDDPDVEAVFVTVAEVRVDGQAIEGFQRTTVELSALQNGRTADLGSYDLEAKTYASVDIVLDAEDNATNTGRGCYVLAKDGTQIALDVANDGVVRIRESDFALAADATVTAVIDFDLRKALIRVDDTSEPYRFAAEARLRNSVRFVQKEQSGTLTGEVNNSTTASGDIVIYAYTAGSYAASERQGDDDELFLNAVASTTVSSNGDYTLAFLPAGNYELVAVSYQDRDSDGKAELAGTFTLNALAGINLGGLSVGAQSNSTVNFSLLALLP